MVPQLRTDGREQPGVRAGSGAIVHVDLERLYRDNATIYFSVNNVILTAGLSGKIPPQYLRRIERVSDGREMWPLGRAPMHVLLALSTERREAATMAAAA
eukprot:5319356-Alexandrium_andersonii.AAC.1